MNRIDKYINESGSNPSLDQRFMMKRSVNPAQTGTSKEFGMKKSKSQFINAAPTSHKTPSHHPSTLKMSASGASLQRAGPNGTN